MPEAFVASIIGRMRVTTPGRIVIFAIALVPILDPPATMLSRPHGPESPPATEMPASSGQQAPSSPVKQAGRLIEYRNRKYSFCFSLPQGWRGYSIGVDQWEGYSNGLEGDAVVQRGPLISIRHPGWTRANPRQDIPIMVFTLDQWKSVQREEFHVSAAPIGPSELGRNRKYVFALPPRFDWAFPTGYEEVEQILRSNPLRGCGARRGSK